MPNFLIASIYHLLSLVNGVASFAAVFGIIAMMTNSNGFLSGAYDLPLFLLLLSTPVCFVVSGVLYKFRGERLAAILVGLLPAAIALGLYVVTHSL